jgi:sugar-specific transcriptional regulator TrmB
MIESLLKLGLAHNEAEVYSSLIQLGPTTAGEIIKKSQLHRNIVYDNLERLIQKGLVSFVVIRRVKHFQTTAVKEIREYIEEQKKEMNEKEGAFRELIYYLEKKKESKENAEASIYHGKIGLKSVFEELVIPGKELLIFATGWGMKKTMGAYYEQWHLKLRENKVKGRALLSKKMKQTEKFPYALRYLPEEFTLPSTILIYGNKVINVIWQEEPITIVLSSQKIAVSYKKYFELLWKKAEK